MISRIISIIIIVALVIGPSSATAFETTPADGETGFPVDGRIIIEFDDPMDTGTLDVDITPDPVYPVEKVWTNNDRILTLRPTVDLLAHRTYTIQIHGEDLNGHNVVETFSFETGYLTAKDDDGRPRISGYIIPIFIIIAIIAVTAVYITLKGIRKKKGH